jgi:hypothetical protein
MVLPHLDCGGSVARRGSRVSSVVPERKQTRNVRRGKSRRPGFRIGPVYPLEVLLESLCCLVINLSLEASRSSPGSSTG